MNALQKKARLFHAMGEPTRLKVLVHLLGKKEPVCICHLSEYAGKDQSTVFRHIQILRDAGLVLTQKRGLFLFCTAKDKRRTKILLGD